MARLSSTEDFINKVKASLPLLWVNTYEEHRALMDFVSVIQKTTVRNQDSTAEESYKAYTWDIMEGIRTISINGQGEMVLGKPVDKTKDPVKALEWLSAKDPTSNKPLIPDNTILFLKDYHTYMSKYKDADMVCRKIRNDLNDLKGSCKILVVMAPVVEIPPTLDKEINVINFRLPDRDNLKKVLHGVCESASIDVTSAKYKTEIGPLEESLVDAALGMTENEAENAYSLCLIEVKKFDPAIVRREKASIVKKTKTLEVFETDLNLDSIGGQENLKAFLLRRKKCSSTKAKTYGCRALKGIVCVGPPGTGKSLLAKASAGCLGRPLLKLDLGNVMDKYVGNSEHNMAKVLEMADAISPCVLWIDEVEKDIAGAKNGEAHEVSEKILKMLLNWMQERKSEVFVVMTANQVASLPPELLRSGRIDGVWWVDLPDDVQRAEIIRIQLKKAERKPDMFDKDMDKLVTLSAGWTGAEIETWINEAVVIGFDAHENSDITFADLQEAAKEITPISTLMKEDIEKARKWKTERHCKEASITHASKTKAGETSAKPRKLDLSA